MTSLVWLVTLYGCETWTMRKEEMDTLAAFEMWIWRKMEEISRTERKSSKEILGLVEVKGVCVKLQPRREKPRLVTTNGQRQQQSINVSWFQP